MTYLYHIDPITHYFLKPNGEIETDTRPGPTIDQMEMARKYKRLPCVRVSEDKKLLAYGFYNFLGWQARSIHKVPKKLKTILMLLEVNQ